MILPVSSNPQHSHPLSSSPSRRHSSKPLSTPSPSSSWQIPTEFIGHLESREVIRQSAIHEIITGEAEYLDDLKIYQNIFIEPLQIQLSPAIFQHIELERFLDQVVSSLGDIRKCSRSFLKRLRHRQQAQQPLVESVGDVILSAALEWGPAYVRYAADHPLGELEIERQISQNLLFAEHISNIPRFNTRKKDFRHFYSRATFRLARYVLLFTRLLEATPEDHVDREPLRLALELVRRQCSECNAAIESQQDIVSLMRLNSMIAPKSDIPLLHLHSSHRKIYNSGKMLRKKDGGSGIGEWSEVFVVLFDHYFVMLKEKKDDGHSRPRYHIVEQPIRTEFLKLSGLTQPPEKRSRRLKTLTDGLRGHNTTLNTASTSPQLNGRSLPTRRSNSEPINRHSYVPTAEHPLNETESSLQQSRCLYPMTLQPFGESPRVITLYVESESARQHWRERFETAINHRVQSIKTSQVFELWPMALETFSIPSSSSSSSSLVNLPSLAELKVLYEDQIPKELLPNTVHHGAPTCSTPFTAPDGRPLIAIGCKDGLWIGKRDNSSSYRKVLPVKNITQISFLQSERYIVILAGQVLLAYPLEVLVHSPGVKPARPLTTRSITANSNLTYLPKPARPTVPYHHQQPHQQILSRATSASSQQSARSRQSSGGTEVESPVPPGRSSLLLSLGLFEFEKKQGIDEEVALSSSGCDETSASSTSFQRISRFGMDSRESSVPSSPDSSCKRFREFTPIHHTTGRHRRMTSDSCSDIYRKLPSLGIAINHRASAPMETPTDCDKRRGVVRLSGPSEKVRFFKIGMLEHRLVLIYAAKAKGCQTIFKILEPISASNEQISFTLFKENQEFTVPYEAHDVLYHESQNKLFVLHGNRCEVHNLDDSSSETIPRLEDNRDEPACSILIRPADETGRMRIELDIDYSDRVTLAIETKVVVNFPTTRFAVLPISLGLTLNQLSATIMAEIPPIAIPLPMNDDPSAPSPAILMSLDPDFTLSMTTISLLGSRAKLQDMPKIEQLIMGRLRGWIVDNLVWPKVRVLKLPGLGNKGSVEDAADGEGEYVWVEGTTKETNHTGNPKESKSKGLVREADEDEGPSSSAASSDPPRGFKHSLLGPSPGIPLNPKHHWNTPSGSSRAAHIPPISPCDLTDSATRQRHPSTRTDPRQALPDSNGYSNQPKPPGALPVTARSIGSFAESPLLNLSEEQLKHSTDHEWLQYHRSLDTRTSANNRLAEDRGRWARAGGMSGVPLGLGGSQTPNLGYGIRERIREAERLKGLRANGLDGSFTSQR